MHFVEQCLPFLVTPNLTILISRILRKKLFSTCLACGKLLKMEACLNSSQKFPKFHVQSNEDRCTLCRHCMFWRKNKFDDFCPTNVPHIEMKFMYFGTPVLPSFNCEPVLAMYTMIVKMFLFNFYLFNLANFWLIDS